MAFHAKLEVDFCYETAVVFSHSLGNMQPDENHSIDFLGLRMGRFVAQLTCVIVAMASLLLLCGA